MTNVNKQSLAIRIRDTFIAPGRLASGIRADAPWLDVLLISTAVAVISVLAIPQEVFLEPMEDAVTRRGEPVEITSPAGEVALWGRAIGMLATLGTHPLLAFVVAGLLTVVFTIVGGGSTPFREYLSLAAHALLIPALGTAIVFVIRVALGERLAQGFAGAIFGSGEPGSLAAAVAGGIDPFMIWMLTVLAVGVNRLDSRRSTGSALVILFAGYLILIFASAYLLYPELR